MLRAAAERQHEVAGHARRQPGRRSRGGGRGVLDLAARRLQVEPRMAQRNRL